jgi:hypothetical protein
VGPGRAPLRTKGLPGVLRADMEVLYSFSARALVLELDGV